MEQAFLIAMVTSLFQSLGAWIGMQWGGANDQDKQKIAVLAGAGAIIKGVVAAIFGTDSVTKESSKIFWEKFCQKGFENFITGAGIGVVAAIYAGIESGKVLSEILYIDYGT